MSEGFKTQKEIWGFLIGGGMLINSCNFIIKLNEDGNMVHRHKELTHWSVSSILPIILSDWSIYKEPPKKTKVVLRRYWYKRSNGKVDCVDSINDWGVNNDGVLLETEILAEREF